MNVSVKQLLAFAILLTISQTIQADYDVDAYCTLVANNVRLASIDNCETYYTCNNGKATKATCPNTQAFDKDTQGCRPESDVQCYLNKDKPCLLKSEGFVPLTGTCNQYIYCRNYAEVGRGTCPNGQIFHQEQCVYGTCNENINEGNAGLNSVCEIMPDNIFFGNTRDCKIWQKCTKGSLSSGSCGSDFVFDVQLSKCNYESGNMCSRVTGQDIQPDPSPTRPCTNAQKGVKDADVTTCSVYYVCDGSKWVRNYCGNGLYYSVPTQKCELRQYATPSEKCNRCEFSKKQFVNAVDPDCRGYQVCASGAYKGKGSCDDKSYFDEASQACILDTNGLSTYASKNGACLNCGTTCGALSGDKCLPTSGCPCGLDEADECIECSGAIVNRKCEDGNGGDDECDETCSKLSGAKCVPTGDCNCGLEGTDCIVCPGDIDQDGNCETDTPAVDCSKECTALALNKCVPSDDCKCGVNEGACTVCDKASDCNECVCEGSDCAKGTQCECYEDDNGKCIACAADEKLNTAGDACEAE